MTCGACNQDTDVDPGCGMLLLTADFLNQLTVRDEVPHVA
jgi:hypothetical protein